MIEDRDRLKSSLMALLDCIAAEHPLEHQDSKAQRYVLTSRHAQPIEIMFEKNDKSPPNLWCLTAAAGAGLQAEVPNKSSLSSKLRSEIGKKGTLQYGRHSALEHMPQLGEADLTCFAPTSFQQIGQIVDRLLNVTAADLL